VSGQNGQQQQCDDVSGLVHLVYSWACGVLVGVADGVAFVIRLTFPLFALQLEISC
jgi:hypothetical protein